MEAVRIGINLASGRWGLALIGRGSCLWWHWPVTFKATSFHGQKEEKNKAQRDIHACTSCWNSQSVSQTARVLVKNPKQNNNNLADQPAYWTWQGGALSKRLLIVHSQLSCRFRKLPDKRFKAKSGRVCTTGHKVSPRPTSTWPSNHILSRPSLCFLSA